VVGADQHTASSAAPSAQSAKKKKKKIGYIESGERRGIIADPTIDEVVRMADIYSGADAISRKGQAIPGASANADGSEATHQHMAMNGDFMSAMKDGKSTTAGDYSVGDMSKEYAGGFGTSEAAQRMGASPMTGGVNVGGLIGGAIGVFGAKGKVDKSKARLAAMNKKEGASAAGKLLAKRELKKNETYLAEKGAGGLTSIAKTVGGEFMPTLNFMGEMGKAKIEADRAIHHASGAMGINDFSSVGKNIKAAKHKAMRDTAASGLYKTPEVAHGMGSSIRNWSRRRSAKKSFKHEYHQLLKKARKGDESAHYNLHHGAWADYHRKKRLDKNRRFLHNTKAVKAAEHGTLAAGHALDGAGSLTMAADGGTTRATGKLLKGSVGVKRSFSRGWARASQVGNLAKSKNELGHKGKKNRGMGWKMKQFMFGDIERQQRSARDTMYGQHLDPSKQFRHNRLLHSKKQRHAMEMAKAAADGAHGTNSKNAQQLFVSSGIIPKRMAKGMDWGAQDDYRGDGDKALTTAQLVRQDLGESLSDF